jgi:cysteinyl-tRNA synthetase
MSLLVYNTLTRKKEPFQPVNPGKVGVYVCGPTVYKPSHIGHAVGPIIFDAIKRYLVHRGYEVTWVVNITDVDDKLIVEAASQDTTVLELAERVTRDYLDAMGKLHVDTIDIMPKASEHIGDIIGMIEKLIERGYAYPSGGDVYFDVTKDDDYGKLSNRAIEEQSGQRELKSGEKRNPGDFALWKAAKPEEPDDVKFDSPWGKGRPGWHIECSAMSSRYLGETFDIHGGGLDLIFPHHENEIAQSESASGKTFAKCWMHHGLTRVNTKKVSKSDASPEMVAALQKMTLRNLLAEYSPELIRFFVLSTQYRRPIEYSEQEIESKRRGLDTFYRLFERVERVSGKSPFRDVPELPRCSESDRGPLVATCATIGDESLKVACIELFEKFHQAMDDDFNTAGAIAAMFDFAPAVNRCIEQYKLESASDATDARREDVHSATQHLIAVARTLGLFLDPPPRRTPEGDDGLADKAMQVLIEVRQHVRKKKDFETADLIRDLLAKERITLEDRPDGTIWRVG